MLCINYESVICINNNNNNNNNNNAVKVQVSSPWNRPLRLRGKVQVLLYSFLNLGTRWGWVVKATPRPLYPRERPNTHFIGGWVGPRACLDECGKSRPYRDSIPGPFLPVASHYTVYANNTEVINNNYGRLQELIFLFKLSVGTRKYFFEICRQLGHATSESFASPGKGVCLISGCTSGAN